MPKTAEQAIAPVIKARDELDDAFTEAGLEEIISKTNKLAQELLTTLNDTVKNIRDMVKQGATVEEVKPFLDHLMQFLEQYQATITRFYVRVVSKYERLLDELRKIMWLPAFADTLTKKEKEEIEAMKTESKEYEIRSKLTQEAVTLAWKIKKDVFPTAKHVDAFTFGIEDFVKDNKDSIERFAELLLLMNTKRVPRIIELANKVTEQVRV